MTAEPALGTSRDFATVNDVRTLEDCLRRAGASAQVREIVRFVFDRYRTGVYVALRRGRLHFVPFENLDYVNPYAAFLLMPSSGDIARFIRGERADGQRVRIERDPHLWTTSGHLVRIERRRGRHASPPRRSVYFSQALKLFRIVAAGCPDLDRDVVLSYRDRHHLLRNDSSDPMVHLVGRINAPLPSQPLSSSEIMRACPFLAFSSMPTVTDRDLHGDVRADAEPGVSYLDLAIPTPDDMDSLSLPRDEELRTAWHQRVPRAVFRGLATGLGTDTSSNQRLLLSSIGAEAPDLLAAGITGIPRRFKKLMWNEGLVLNPPESDFPLCSPLSTEDQTKFRYQIYVEGNGGAYRLGGMLRSRSVILRVESRFRLWFDDELRPWEHFVPVRADLSDLLEKVRWCRDNDPECRAMVETAAAVGERLLSRAYIVGHMRQLLKQGA